MSTALDKIFQRAAAEAAESQSPPPAATPAKEQAPAPVAGQSLLREVPIAALEDFPRHPFKAYTAEKMAALQESIARNGVIVRLLVRPQGDGVYQIVAGHNRRTAARMAGYVAVPCEVRVLTDDEAEVQMIETNLQQREGLLPSEKAWAYRLRLEAMNRQGMRTDLTPRQVGTMKRSDEELSLEVSDSARQIQRYIRLTYLFPPLLERVDDKKLGLTVGADLSYLSTENQVAVHDFCCTDQERPITQQIVDKLRTMDEQPLTEEILQALFSPVVTAKPPRVVPVAMKPLRRFFVPEATPETIQQTIHKALAAYFEAQGGIPFGK